MSQIAKPAMAMRNQFSQERARSFQECKTSCDGHVQVGPQQAAATSGEQRLFDPNLPGEHNHDPDQKSHTGDDGIKKIVIGLSMANCVHVLFDGGHPTLSCHHAPGKICGQTMS
jgi:hypothetical protein